MNDTTCTIAATECLGSLSNANYLMSCPGIRFTRTHLLTTGWHIDLSTLAEQAGFQVHVFFRIEAFKQFVGNEIRVENRNADLYMAMFALRHAVMKAPLRGCPVLFQMGETTLIAHFGKVDHDDPRPAITVALASNQPKPDDDSPDE